MPRVSKRAYTSNLPARGSRHILYVDAYDSFSNSIVGLLEQSLGADVTTVRIDDRTASENLTAVLKAFDAVVVGPGPGHPANPDDVGLINQLWGLDEQDLLPVFGICLGFQSLCLAHGASVKRLKQARHGIISNVLHNRTDIFKGVVGLRATQYHSLHVHLGTNSSESVEPYWEPNEDCPKIQPLAWDVEDELNGTILMGAKHTAKPFWGVQFHPESICTSKEGTKLLQKWWVQADEWLTSCSRTVCSERAASLSYISPATTTTAVRGALKDKSSNRQRSAVSSLAEALQQNTGSRPAKLQWTAHAGQISPTALVEALGLDGDEIILLDSQNHSMGHFSLLGVVVPGETVKVTYRSWDRTLRYGTDFDDEHLVQLQSIDQIWPVLQEALDVHDPKNQSHQAPRSDRENMPEESPFWGGFMGYISYEAGLETIGVEPHESLANSSTPDINFAFVHRSIVVDHASNKTYVQSLLPNDARWIENIGHTIETLLLQSTQNTPQFETTRDDTHATRELRESLEMEKRLGLSQIRTPQERHYRNKVLDCQSSLAAGDSYELCLTDETLITVPKIDGQGVSPWALYKKLRRKNPAPYGAYLQLSNATVVGTSPERFLKWDREGNCQFRPIKGTVKKSPAMTREIAHGILNSSKEQAENLMIVDLIRHDLSGVIGAERCSVPKLMTVEEYEHVYQLVSVIEGQLPAGSSDGKNTTGLDVLKASLPPGSMTGAPKKRSCEILREIEKRPRGIYSGVLGYLDVGGAGDFSVVIRTAVRDASTGGGSKMHRRTDDSGDSTPRSNLGCTPAGTSPRSTSPFASVRDVCSVAQEGMETWRIGAGGAVTIQSTDEGEYLEMETKVMTALTAFQSK